MKHRSVLAPVLMLACLLWAPVDMAAESAMPPVGSVPPDKLGRNLDNEPVLLSDSAGKIRVITFWANWCAPCLKELPILNALQKQAGADRLQVIAINLKQKKRMIRAIRDQLDDNGVQWIRDLRGRTAKRYGVGGIPHLLIIDGDNTIVHRHVGYSESTLPQIVDELNAMLGQ